MAIVFTKAGSHELDIDVCLVERIEQQTGEPIFGAIETAFGISLAEPTNLDTSKISISRTRNFLAGAMGCEPEELGTIFTPGQYIQALVVILGAIMQAFTPNPQTPGDPASASGSVEPGPE